MTLRTKFNNIFQQRRGYIQILEMMVITVHSQYKGGIFDPNGEVYTIQNIEFGTKKEKVSNII